MEKSSFFKSVAGDRKYKVEDFAAFFNSLITNGVFPNPSTNLQVISNNNMTVTIKAGKAWINGYCYINDSDLILPVAVADGVLKRIDRVVIRFDTVGRAINAVVKKGVFASSPVAPVLQRDADGYELGIADIYIANGAVAISQANITDLRFNTTLCGVVNSLITADTTTLFAQYESGFNTWFAGIQNILGADVAGNLLNQINGLAGTGRTIETVKGNADAISALGSSVATSLAEMGSQIDDVSTQLKNYNSYSSGIDSNGIYKVVEYKRTDTTLYMKSTLSNPNANLNYQTVTLLIYALDGITLVATTIWTITYDADGNIISKVVS